jgi:hypothetical protein
MGYVVAVPLAIVRTSEGTLIHLYDGQPVPDNADPADLERLAAGGFLAEVNESAAVPAEPEPVQPVQSAPTKPAGNASYDAWATYVVESGHASEDEVSGLTRDELRELYG